MSDTEFMWSVPCDICQSPAAKYHCNTCGDTLCNMCSEYHSRSRGTGSHSIVNYTDKVDPKDMRRLYCKVHTNSKLEFWCDTCGVGVCPKCITTEHRGHEFSDLISMVMNKRDKMREELNILRYSTLGKWEEQLEEAKDNRIAFTDDVEKIDKDLITRANEIHEHVDAILLRRRKQLQMMCKTSFANLQFQEETLSEGVQNIKHTIRQYEQQLGDAFPEVILRFPDEPCVNNIYRCPPSESKQSLPILTSGQDDVPALDKMFGELTQEEQVSQTDKHQLSRTRWYGVLNTEQDDNITDKPPFRYINL